MTLFEIHHFDHIEINSKPLSEMVLNEVYLMNIRINVSFVK